VIGHARQVAVYAFDEPCDMRKSFDTLSALVAEKMKHDLFTGHLFLFVSKNRKRAKVLYFDGTGLCLLAKRLEKGRFAAVWERAQAGANKLTMSELSLFIEGSLLVAKNDLSPPLLTLKDLAVFSREKRGGKIAV
jgi:transposase